MTKPKIPEADGVADATLPLVPEEGFQEPHPPPSGPASSGAPDAILAMIERAARDKDVDIEKFERLMAMKERVEKERASIAFAQAFAELQLDLPTIDRNGQIIVYSKADRDKPGGVPIDATPIQKTRYATLDDILEALREPLAKHGFSIRFEHESTADNRLTTTAILRHRLGHEQRATIPPLKHDTTGSKNDVQAIGSALSYGRRYSLMAVLPIVSHSPQDADDDGRAAAMARIDVDQLAYIEQQLRDTGIDIARFLEKVRAQSLPELTVKQYQDGLVQIREYQRRKAQKAAQ